MARRPQLTEAGLLAESFGTRPYTVTLREEKAAGVNVNLDYTVSGGARRKPTLRYPVRRQVGKRWEWDEDALQRARQAAEDKSAELRLARMREDVLEAETLTFGDALTLYLDDQRGGLPRDEKTRREYRRRLARWAAYLGAERPWNAIRRSEVTSWARAREAEGKVPDALNAVATLRTLHRWLDRQAGIEGLTDLVKGFDWKKLRESHTVRRPRYQVEQVRAIVKVRHDVDPRFALFLALMDDSGARSKALRILHRSAVDALLEMPPSHDEAPHGWALLPALKGQKAPLVLLTAFQRRELEVAFSGYLRELEARWQAERADYPLFPGARIGDKKEKVVGVDQPGAYRTANPKVLLRFLYDAEKAAGLEHVTGRSYHGIRRVVSDHLYDALGLDGVTTAMGWSNRSTPEQIYIDQRRMKDRIGAREAMERKRETVDES